MRQVLSNKKISAGWTMGIVSSTYIYIASISNMSATSWERGLHKNRERSQVLVKDEQFH